MAGVRIVVDAIEAEQKNAEGGRTITVSGRTSSKAVGYCALTFPTAADLKKLKDAIDAAQARQDLGRRCSREATRGLWRRIRPQSTSAGARSIGSR